MKNEKMSRLHSIACQVINKREPLLTVPLLAESLAFAFDKLKGLGAEHEAATHSLSPEVLASYSQFKQDLLWQWLFLTNEFSPARLVVERWTHSGEPYSGSVDMLADLATGHLYYLPTDETGLPEDHPLRDFVSLVYDSSGYMMRYNDIFRVVHDALGHGPAGCSFGPRGETKAFLWHSECFSPLAFPALACETVMQNAWVNFGPHDPFKLAPKDRPFAAQKCYIPSDLVLSLFPSA